MSKTENTITLKIDGEEVEFIRKDSIQEIPSVEGNYAIIRCRNAGVHAGYVQKRENGVLTIANSRRLWRWWSKFTLSGLAMSGVLKGKESECRFACVVPLLDLTDSDVAEVIYCTDDARKSIESIEEHTNV